MIYTARQLEDLWKASGANGQLVLPYRARLSPLAADWVKAKKITLGYSDEQAKANPTPAEAAAMARAAAAAGPAGSTEVGTFLWWCDGPCGTVKAAITGVAREASLAEVAMPADPGQLTAAIRHVAKEVKAGRAAGAILAVRSAAAAVVYANRCPSLRAVVGTCLHAVEEGIRLVAANVLVVEHPHVTLSQARNLLLRFVKARRAVSEDLGKALGEMGTCA